MKSILLFICMIVINGFLFGETTLQMTPLGNVAITNPYDYIVQLENGDLQFYRIDYSTSTLNFYGFQFLADSNSVTPEVLISSVPNTYNLQTNNSDHDWLTRFNRFYLIHKIPGGIVCFVLDHNNLSTYYLMHIVFGESSGFARHVEIVDANTLIAVEDTMLVKYNLTSATHEILLEGSNYWGHATQNPLLLYLPVGYFVLVGDDYTGAYAETWRLFTSQGTLLRTMIYNNDFLTHGALDAPSGQELHKVFGRWYLSSWQINWIQRGLECSLTEDDSLHIYPVLQLDAENEFIAGYYPLGNDRILELTGFLFTGAGVLSCYLAPMEINAEPTESWVIYADYLQIFALSPNIVVSSGLTNDNMIMFKILWEHIYPEPLTFSFPSPFVGSSPFEVFSQNDTLHIVTANYIISFKVDEVTGIETDTANPIEPKLMVYPNPIKASSKLKIVLPNAKPGVVEIFNIKGQKIQSVKTDGKTDAIWDTKDINGNQVSSGIYIVRYQTGNKVLMKQVLFVK